MADIKRIFIIGHPGAGKMVLGKALADKLGWKFVDADFGLEVTIGRHLPAIIGQEGANALYQCESEILTYQLGNENIVVATDGSIAMSEQNRKLLSSEFVVYLKVSLPMQLERLALFPLPLLPTVDLNHFLDKLHQERDALYEQMAKISFSTDDYDIDKHLLTVISELNAAGN